MFKTFIVDLGRDFRTPWDSSKEQIRAAPNAPCEIGACQRLYRVQTELFRDYASAEAAARQLGALGFRVYVV